MGIRARGALANDAQLVRDRDRDVDVRALVELRRAIDLDGPPDERSGVAADLAPDVARDQYHDHLVAPAITEADLQERVVAARHDAALKHRAFERARNVDRARDGLLVLCIDG